MDFYTRAIVISITILFLLSSCGSQDKIDEQWPNKLFRHRSTTVY